MATKARTARKKAVKPVKMWALVYDDGDIIAVKKYREDAEDDVRYLCKTDIIPVLVTPAHKGKP